MAEDWRLELVLSDEGAASALTERYEAARLDQELEAKFEDRVVVSHDDTQVFCYAASRAPLERAEQVAQSIAAGEDWTVTGEIRRWHPEAEEWQDPDQPLPSTPAEHHQETEERVEDEERESLADGHPEWEVRVTCASHREAKALSERLEAEGVPHLTRWKFLLLGATDEVAARELADRLAREAPDDAQIGVEASAWFAVKEAPFDVFPGWPA
jgi:hypothetical protein